MFRISEAHLSKLVAYSPRVFISDDSEVALTRFTMLRECLYHCIIVRQRPERYCTADRMKTTPVWNEGLEDRVGEASGA